MSASDSNPADDARRDSHGSERAFSLADSLILVAATGLGLGLIRAIASLSDLSGLWQDIYRVWTGDPNSRQILEVTAACLLVAGQPFLAAWTAAVLVLRMRQPRPPRRHLLTQPGTMACLSGTCAIGLAVLVSGALWVLARLSGGSIHEVNLAYVLIYASTQVGAAILWTWVTMALLGHWRPEAHWLDRVGRFLGALWILTAIAGAIVMTDFT